MRVRVMFKTPDALDETMQNMEEAAGENFDEAAVREFFEKWVKYGEMIVVEFDLEAKTAKVVEQ